MQPHPTALLLALSAFLAVPPRPAGPPLRHAAPPRVVVNDNRAPAGTLRGGVLTLRLEARLGEWHPDGEGAPGAVVAAFAEPGRAEGAPRIPGPLVRVPAGTEVAITLHNALPDTLGVGGMDDRPAVAGAGRPAPAALPAFSLAPGTTREVRFRLSAPGTYYYWGTTMGRSVDNRTREDSQLTGAIVVDEPGRPAPSDRIFVIGMWSDTAGRALVVRTRLLAVINGRSWPHTERLDYMTGDTARWRVLNASADSHPMHLHGFYFRLESRGDGRGDTTYAAADRRLAVTEDLPPGTTMTLSWVPDRPGNWLFHCHLPDHFGPRAGLGLPRHVTDPTRAAPHAAMNHALGEMNGLVMGVRVRAAPGTPAVAAVPDAARRRLRLVVASRSDPGSGPRFAYRLEGSGTGDPAADNPAAPAIVLVRGQPVAITVVNTLPVSTAVHWHGIELESYYDGVPGFSGAGTRLAPMIAPGDSFVARFTPPRAGTFIYHTHADEENQQREGLAGAIVVLEPGVRRDPETDRDIMFSSPRDAADDIRTVLVDGSLAPPPLRLHAGTAYRLRFINMTLRRPGMSVSVRRDSSLATWRQLAKDGADLPAARQAPRPARAPLSIGETVDVELTPEATGSWQLEVLGVRGQLVAARRIEVVP